MILTDTLGASLVAQSLKNLPAVQETWVWSLHWEDPLEKETATYSSILAWKISWTEEPGGLQSVRSQRVRHDWATNTYLLTSHSLVWSWANDLASFWPCLFISFFKIYLLELVGRTSYTWHIVGVLEMKLYSRHVVKGMLGESRSRRKGQGGQRQAD